MQINNEQNSIVAMLQNYTHIAVVGLSPRSDRASYAVAGYLQANGYDIIPINPVYAGQTILQRPVYASLADAQAAGETIEIVDVFRRSEQTPDVARAAVQAGAKLVWLQLGIANEEAAQIAHEAGLEFVEDRCIKIEHARLL